MLINWSVYIKISRLLSEAADCRGIMCSMTVQLPCLRKDIAASHFNAGFIWLGMSYMVIGGVTLGCTEYQTRSHNVVHIIEIRFDWTLESHSHIRDIFQLPLRKRFPQIWYMVNMTTTTLLSIRCHKEIDELCLYEQWKQHGWWGIILSMILFQISFMLTQKDNFIHASCCSWLCLWLSP